MTFSWQEYMTWTHETAVRRSDGRADTRERSELMLIWGLGLGGEFLEMLLEDGETVVMSPKMKTEAGDYVWYLARLYVDTGNERREDPFYSEAVTFKDVIRGAKDLVETIKKALRKHGFSGLMALATPEDAEFTVIHAMPEGERTGFREGKASDRSSGNFPGRRAEFGKLLDRSLSAFEHWLVERGSSLEEVCVLNQENLRKRRADGTISVLGERYAEMLNEKVYYVNEKITPGEHPADAFRRLVEADPIQPKMPNSKMPKYNPERSG